MSKTQLAGFVTTNVDHKSIQDGFLQSLAAMLAKLLHTEVEYVTLELHCNVAMLKAGSGAPMLTLRLFHNSDWVTSDTKHDHAQRMASWLSKQIRVPEDRRTTPITDTQQEPLIAVVEARTLWQQSLADSAEDGRSAEADRGGRYLGNMEQYGQSPGFIYRHSLL